MYFSSISLSFGPNDQFILPLKKIAKGESIIVKGIDGLDPPAIDNQFGDKLFEGSEYQGSRPQNREITVLLGLEPNYKLGQTYSSIRGQLYGLLTPKYGYPVTFGLLDDAQQVVASVPGYIKSMNTSPFSKNMDIQLVLTCMSPYLNGPEYSVPNPTIQPVNPLIFDNPGNAPSGFKMQIQISDDYNEFGADSITISKASFGDILKFTPPSHINPGDILTINTEHGKKQATNIRGGVEFGDTLNMLPYMSTSSEWFQLHGGINNILVKMDATYTPLWRLNYLIFTPRYWGI
jgi:hypothetical protein